MQSYCVDGGNKGFIGTLLVVSDVNLLPHTNQREKTEGSNDWTRKHTGTKQGLMKGKREIQQRENMTKEIKQA